MQRRPLSAATGYKFLSQHGFIAVLDTALYPHFKVIAFLGAEHIWNLGSDDANWW